VASAPDEWWQVLSLHVGDTAAVPMLGSWKVAGDTLVFQPRFPPSRGTVYVARLNAAALGNHLTGSPITAAWEYAPHSGAPTTTVAAIYPSADVLPMNLLRMYVQFSAPMTTGRSYQYVRLHADGDSLVAEPFFTAAGAVELWDPDKTRLTILFDPGRIKRDLLPHEQLGLPLQEGGRYRLVIDSSWPDAAGRPLVGEFEKRFQVSGMDRTLVRSSDWTLSVPASGTREPLVVDFPEPLDHALLFRMFTVRNATDTLLPGEAGVSRHERRWSFTPVERWARSTHHLEVDTELEDLVGNNLRRLFDVAPGDTAATGVTQLHVRLPFTPR